MKTTFKVAKNDLLKELQSVGAVINTKVTTPALTNIHCEIIDDKLFLIGNNGEQQVETSLSIVDSTSDTSFLIEKNIIDSLKTLPEQPLKFIINTDTHSLVVEHSSGDFNFQILEAQDYPKMKVLQNEKQEIITIPAGRLKLGLEKNQKQMADDELRPVMNGIYIDITKEHITFVASDGHRLSRYTDTSLTGNEKNNFLLPRNTVPVLIKQLATIAYDENIHIQISSRNVFIILDKVTVTSRLIEGRYPNYNSVIPENGDKELTIDSKELSTILNRLLITSNNTTKLIKIESTPMQTIFSSEDIDFAKSAKENTDYKCTGDITIGLKGTFFLDLISNLSGDITMYFTDPSRAVLIKPTEQEEDIDYTLLLMPMMLNN